MNLRRFVKNRRPLRADTRAATVVEYGLIVALVVIVTISAIVAVADATSGIWNDVNFKVTRAR